MKLKASFSQSRYLENMQSHDEKMMQGALAMARRHLGQTGPNPSVGCVIVKEEKGQHEIIARAVTGQGGRPHAEPQALEVAGHASNRATLYVTLEPCNHHGKTPPCTDAIIKAGIKRVVIAAIDKNPQVAGQGIERLKTAGIEVEVGVCAAAAEKLLVGHFKVQTENRPHTIVKMALSQDGLILPGNQAGDGPRWVTSKLARQRAWLARAEVDAIMIGKGTALIDDPALTCRLRGLEHRSPIPIILDKNLDLPPTLQLFAQTTPWVIHANMVSVEQKAAYNQRNATLIEVGLTTENLLDLTELSHKLAEKGITRLLIEGGPSLAKSYLSANLVDELLIMQGSFQVGDKGQLPFKDKDLAWALSQGPFALSHTLPLLGNEQRLYKRRY